MLPIIVMNDEKQHTGGVTRRNVLGGALMLAACGAVPSLGHATLAQSTRSLHLHNIHTGETLKTTYWERGIYIPEAMRDISHTLRDYRNNQSMHMDPKLIDLIARLHARMNSRKPFEVISGYRSAQTNAMLHAHSGEVATHSMHLHGKAIDLRLTDRSLRDLHHEASLMHSGGVGYYPTSGFVHIDTGRDRHWQGT